MIPSYRKPTAAEPTVEPEILKALHALLELTSSALLAAYPFPDDLLIKEGQYTAVNAFSSTLITQIAGIRDTLQYYQDCLDAERQAPPKTPEEPAPDFSIPF